MNGLKPIQIIVIDGSNFKTNWGLQAASLTFEERESREGSTELHMSGSWHFTWG